MFIELREANSSASYSKSTKLPFHWREKESDPFWPGWHWQLYKDITYRCTCPDSVEFLCEIDVSKVWQNVS